MEAGGGAAWSGPAARGWSPTAVAMEKPETESDEALGELSDAGSGSTAAPERLSTDKSNGSLGGGAAFLPLFSPAGAAAGFSPRDCTQLTPACRSLLNDLQHRTEDVNAALDAVIRLLLLQQQQQRSSPFPVFQRFGRRVASAAEAGGGRKRLQEQHIRCRSRWDRRGRDCSAAPEGSTFSSPASARGSPDAVAAARRSASAAPAAAYVGGAQDQTAVAAAPEDEDSVCCSCGRSFTWNDRQQLKQELERVQQMRLRERARADLQIIKQQAELQKLQHQNQQLEEAISQKDDALRAAQAHLRALQQQLGEKRQLSRVAKAQQRARADLLSVLPLSPTSGSSRQRGQQRKQEQWPEGEREQPDEEDASAVVERKKCSEASVHLRDLTRVSRRLAEHALPADSASAPATQQQRQQAQQHQTPRHETLRTSWEEGREPRKVVTLEHAEEPSPCLSAARLSVKKGQRSTAAEEPTPADLLAEEFRLKIQVLRNTKASGIRLPAMKEWVEHFFSAWRILQARIKSVVVPERPTEKNMQLIKEKLEKEKTLIFKSLVQLQQESLRVMKQVFQTPWRVSELEKEKENQALALSKLREELRQEQTKSEDLSVSLDACRQSLAAVERERDRLLATSGLCAVDVETRFEQLQEKRRLLQESQAAHAQAEAAAAASARQLKTQEQQLREHQQVVVQKQQQLVQKQQQFDHELQQHLATKNSAETARQALQAKTEEIESLRMHIENLCGEKEKLGDALWETQQQLAATAGALRAQESRQQQMHQELLQHCTELQRQLLQSVKRKTLPAALRVTTLPLSRRMRQRYAQKYVPSRLRRCRAERRRTAKGNLRKKQRSSRVDASARFTAAATASASAAAFAAAAGSSGAALVRGWEEGRGSSGESARWLAELQSSFGFPQEHLLWLEETGALERLEQSWGSVLKSIPRVEKQLRYVQATVAAVCRRGAGREELYTADIKEIEDILGRTCSRAAQLRGVLDAIGLPAKAAAALAAEPYQQPAQQGQRQLTELQLVSGRWKGSRKRRQHQQAKPRSAAGSARWTIRNGLHAEKGVEAWKCQYAPETAERTAAHTYAAGDAAAALRTSLFDEPEPELQRVRNGALRNGRSNLWFVRELLPSLAMPTQPPGGAGDCVHLTAGDGPGGGSDCRGGSCARRSEETKDRERVRRPTEQADSEESSSRQGRHEDVEESRLFPSANRIHIREEATCGAYSPLFLQQTSSDCRYSSNSRRRRSSESQKRSSNSSSYSDRRRSSSRGQRRTHRRNRSNPSGKRRGGEGEGGDRNGSSPSGRGGGGEERNRNRSSSEVRSGTPSRKSGCISKSGELSSPRCSVQLHTSSVLCLSSSSNGTLPDTRAAASSKPKRSGSKAACSSSRKERLSNRRSKEVPVCSSSSSVNADGSSSSDSHGAGLRHSVRLRKARTRRFLSETAQHGSSSRSMRRDRLMQRRRRYYSDGRRSFDTRGNCNSGEKEKGVPSRFVPAVAVASPHVASDLWRRVVPAAARRCPDRRQSRSVRRRFSTGSRSVSPCSGPGGAAPFGRLHEVQHQSSQDSEKTGHQDAPCLVVCESANLEQQLHALVENNGQEEYLRAEGMPCISSQSRKKGKSKRLLLLHAFYASHRRARAARCSFPSQPQQEQQQQRKQQQNQPQHPPQDQLQHCGQAKQLQQGHPKPQKSTNESILQGTRRMHFFSVPSVAREPALRKQHHEQEQNVVEGDTQGDEKEEEEADDDDSQHCERSSKTATSESDTPKTGPHQVSLDALHKVEADLQQANKVVQEIESTLLLPADFFRKMRALTQQNLSLNSRLCLLRTEYQRLKREKEELEVRRVAEVDYVKFQEEMQQRIQQLERQLRAGAAESTQRGRKEALSAHTQLGEKGQMESMQIQHALEIRTLKDLSALEAERMRQAHERELSQLQQALRAAQQDMRAELKQRLHVARLQQEATVEQVRCSWETKLQETKQQHEQLLLQQKRVHAEALHRADLARETAVAEEKKAFAKKLQQTEKHWEARLLHQEVQIVKERDSLIARFRERLSRLDEELVQQRREVARLNELLQQQTLHGDRSAAELERQLRDAVLEKSELQAEINRQRDEMEEMQRRLFSSLKHQDTLASVRHRVPSVPLRLQADRSCQVTPLVRSRGTQVEATMLEYLRECAEIAAEAAADAADGAGATYQKEIIGGEEAATAIAEEDVAQAAVLEDTATAVQTPRNGMYSAAPAGGAAGRPRVATARAPKEAATRHDRGLAFFGGHTSEKRVQLHRQRRQSNKSAGANRSQQIGGAAAGDAGGWAQQLVPPRPKRFTGEAHFLRVPSRSSVSNPGGGGVDAGLTKRMHTQEEEDEDGVGCTSLLAGLKSAACTSQERRSGTPREFDCSCATEKPVEIVKLRPSPRTQRRSSGRRDASSLPSRREATRKSFPEGEGSAAAWQDGANGPEDVPAVWKSKGVERALAIVTATAAKTGAPEDARAAVEEILSVKTRSKGSGLWTWGKDREGEAKERGAESRKRDGGAQGDTDEERRDEDEQATVTEESKRSSRAAEKNETRARELFRLLADVTFRARMPSHLLTQHRRHIAKDSSSSSEASQVTVPSAKVHHEPRQAPAAAAVAAIAVSSSSVTADRLDAAASGWKAAAVGAAAATATAAGSKAAAAAAVAREEETAWESWSVKHSFERAAAEDVPPRVHADCRRSAKHTYGTGSPRWRRENSSGSVLQQQHKITNDSTCWATSHSSRPANEHISSSGEKFVPNSTLPYSKRVRSPDGARASDCTNALPCNILPAAMASEKETGSRDRQQQIHPRSTARALRTAAAMKGEDGGQGSTASLAGRGTTARADHARVAARGGLVGAGASTTAPVPAAASIIQPSCRQRREGTSSRAFVSYSTNKMSCSNIPTRTGAETNNQLPETYALERSSVANPMSRLDEASVIATEGDAARSGGFSLCFSSRSTHQDSLLEEEQGSSMSLGKGVIVDLSSCLDVQLRKLQARCRGSVFPRVPHSRSAHADQEPIAAPKQSIAGAAEKKGRAAARGVALGLAAAAAAPGGRGDGVATPDGLAAAATIRTETEAAGRSEAGRGAGARGRETTSSAGRRDDGSWRDLPTSHAHSTMHSRLQKKAVGQTVRSLCRSEGGDAVVRKDLCGQQKQQHICNGSSQQRNGYRSSLQASWRKPDSSVTIESLLQEDEKEPGVLAQLSQAIRREKASQCGA